MPSVADLGSGYRTAARISRPWSVAQATTRRPNGPGLGDHETGTKELVSCDVVAEAAVDEQVGDVPAQHLAALGRLPLWGATVGCHPLTVAP